MTTAFAFAGGVSIVSVHPSVDDAIAASGLLVKRVSRKGAVFKAAAHHLPDGDNGGYYVTQIEISPSEIKDGMWCRSGAEGDPSAEYLEEAFDYFSEEDWMLQQPDTNA